jgi:pre-mRNA-processing factor 40
LEKAEIKKKRLESNFKQLLKIKFDSLTEQSKWEDVKGQIENDNDYLALSLEADRIRLFDEYHRQIIADAQAAAAAAAAHHSHHHHKKARKEKKKRKHERSNSSNAVPVSVSELF